MQEKEKTTQEPKNSSAEQPIQETSKQEEFSSLKEKYLRACADLENQRKRHAREREEFIRYGLAGFVSQLLPFVDNFELALAKASELHPEAKETLDGFAMLPPQLEQILTNAGIKPIKPAPGAPFDPNMHQSTGAAPSDTIPEHTILSTLRPGYQLHDRIIRPAFVLLSSGKNQKE